jgi:hypothetical protein
MILRLMCVVALLAAAPSILPATTVAAMMFDEMVAESAAIVQGRVVRSWASWDPDRTAIWTHYEIRVEAALKGKAGSTMIISEPGGELDGKHMQVVGAPHYEVGEEAVVFAAPTPVGYLRTCGWGQGKFAVRAARDSASGRIVRSAALGVTLVGPAKSPAAGAKSAASYDGADLDAFLSRVRAEIAAQASRAN